MHEDVTRPQVGQQGRRDRRHARRKSERGLGLVPQRQALLEDLEVGVVDARVDEARVLGRQTRLQAVRHLEDALPSSAVRKAKVEVRKMGHFTAPSERRGS